MLTLILKPTISFTKHGFSKRYNSFPSIPKRSISALQFERDILSIKRYYVPNINKSDTFLLQKWVHSIRFTEL